MILLCFEVPYAEANESHTDMILISGVKPAANGPSRSEGGGGAAPPSMGGGPSSLGGLFAGGMPKLRPAGERKPPGGIILQF